MTGAMKVLLNTTKTMDLSRTVPAGLACSDPVFADEAGELMANLKQLKKDDLGRMMGLSERLAAETRGAVVRWGQPGEEKAPALWAFTGLVYQHIDPASWTRVQVRAAQKQVLILSGLHGVLRPLDLVAAYRLEMGCRLPLPGYRNLVEFWRSRLTAAVNEELADGQPILNLAAQEYMKGLVVKELKGPVISPVFKQRQPDGSFKSAAVYAKMARGAMVKYICTTGATAPSDLLGFCAMGWEAHEDVPQSGPWLFCRPFGK